jgi:hypothetical protein
MLERGGKVKAQVIPKRWKEIMQGMVRDGVEKGAVVMTDEASMYRGLKDEYVHEVINHMEGYVRGHISTNGIENFWSLLKRGLGGTYSSHSTCSVTLMSRCSGSITAPRATIR